MQISKITIENFRSIKHAEIDVAEFNVFVGQNNHGKTNIFEAVEWFYSGKGDIREIKHNGCGNDDEVFVEIEFSDIQDGISRITNSDNQSKLKNILGEGAAMRVRRSSKSAKDRLLYHPSINEWKKQPTGADSAFNNCIPRFEFVEATKSLKEVSQFKNTTPIGQMLSAVVEEVLEKDESYREFRSSFEKLFQADDSGIRQTFNSLSEKVKLHLAQQFPDCVKVEFIVNEPQFEELLKNYQTKIDDGIQTTAEEKGDGMQRALMLAIIKTFADFRREDALGRAFIFFIDEAELHLHPAAQRYVELKPSAYTYSVNEPTADYRVSPDDKSNMSKYVFGGFKCCLYPVQKFASEAERVLAVILERDAQKWFKPAKGQFPIFYKQGADHPEYQPDFVAESKDAIYMLEPKASNQMTDPVVLAKKEAAIRWCKNASDYALANGGKPWRYVLIPHNAIAVNMTLDGLAGQF